MDKTHDPQNSSEQDNHYTTTAVSKIVDIFNLQLIRLIEI
jgi:hypothetical protein